MGLKRLKVVEGHADRKVLLEALELPNGVENVLFRLGQRLLYNLATRVAKQGNGDGGVGENIFSCKHQYNFDMIESFFNEGAAKDIYALGNGIILNQLEHIEAIEKRLWSAADTLRANSNYASNEYFLKEKVVFPPCFTRLLRALLRRFSKRPRPNLLPGGEGVMGSAQSGPR